MSEPEPSTDIGYGNSISVNQCFLLPEFQNLKEKKCFRTGTVTCTSKKKSQLRCNARAATNCHRRKVSGPNNCNGQRGWSSGVGCRQREGVLKVTPLDP